MPGKHVMSTAYNTSTSISCVCYKCRATQFYWLNSSPIAFFRSQNWFKIALVGLGIHFQNGQRDNFTHQPPCFYAVSDICRLQTADRRLQTANCRLQTTDYRLQTTDYRRIQWTSVGYKRRWLIAGRKSWRPQRLIRRNPCRFEIMTLWPREGRHWYVLTV